MHVVGSVIPVPDYQRSLRVIRTLGGKVPTGLYALDPVVGARECNWIGSDSAKWASGPLNLFVPWMKPASVPHDCYWSGNLYNDGSRVTFVRSNDEFRDNLDLLANDSFDWAWPRFVRRKLRDARHAEADAAHLVLMSDMCWDIFQKNADFTIGPEVMA